MKRRLIIAAATTIALAFASNASAAPFTGPWDSAHQPPTITTLAMSIDDPSLDLDKLFETSTLPTSAIFVLHVTLPPPAPPAFDQLCGGAHGVGPIPLTVTLSTPNGSKTDSMDCFGIGDYSSLPADRTLTLPVLYTVTNPAGTVIAQDAYTWHVNYSVREINNDTNIDDFINICLDSRHSIHSHNGGELYCMNNDTTGSFTHGWPAPPKPPPPTPTITAGPAHVTTRTTATFRFTDSQAGVNFECRVVGVDDTFTDCESPAVWSPDDGSILKPGAHTFYVHAVDSAGRKSPDASYHWTIAKPPVVHPAVPHIIGHPAKTTTKRTATFRFTESTKTASLEFRLDHQRSHSYLGQGRRNVYAVAYSKLRPGHHTFSVRATQGRQASAWTTYTWTVKR